MRVKDVPWQAAGGGVTSSLARRRTALPTLATVTAAALLPLAAGCAPEPERASYPAASSLGPAVPAETKALAERTVQGFVADVQGGDYAGVKEVMTPALRADAPPTLDAWLDAGRYRPLAGAKGWKVDEVKSLARGEKVLVRAGFTGSDGAPYRTNLVLIRGGDRLLIESVLPPIKPNPALVAGSRTSQSPVK